MTRGAIKRRWFFRQSSTEEPTIEEVIIRKAFDERFYLDAYPDVAENDVDPVKHYIRFGWREGRNPSPEFRTSYYLEAHADVREAGINPFFHYLAEGLKEGRRGAPPEGSDNPQLDHFVLETVAGGFDKSFYLATNPDVARSEADPLVHYLQHGWKEGRDPCPQFSVRYYLEAYPDVAQSGVEPFFHYSVQGKREGRTPLPGDSEATSEGDVDQALMREQEIVGEVFDREFYLRTYPDVAAAGVDPLTHYLTAGWAEGRDPSGTFSTSYYVQSNPDVAHAGTNPLVHYVLSGRAEGRQPRHPGGWRAAMLRDLPSFKDRLSIQSRMETDHTSSLKGLRDVGSSAGEERSPIVISLSHDCYLENSGGIQACISEEQQLLNAAGYTYVHLNPSEPSAQLLSDDSDLVVTLTLDGIRRGRFNGNDLLKAFEDQFADVEVVLIIHALHGHSPQWISLMAGRLKVVKTYFWVHDYYSLCVGHNLLRNDVAYCGAPHVESAGCRLCVYGDARRRHLDLVRKLFQEVSISVIAPSHSALRIWKEKADLPHVEALVYEHRVLAERTQSSAEDRHRSGPIRIAFLGHPASHKGWHVFRELALRSANDPRYQFFHLGIGPDETLPVTYVSVRSSVEGAQAMQEAIQINRIDVVLLWSLWPETFCLAAYEALAAGAIVLTTNVSGNVADLIRDKSWGKVLESDEDLYEFFVGDAVSSLVEAVASNHRPAMNFSGITAPFILAMGERKHKRAGGRRPLQFVGSETFRE